MLVPLIRQALEDEWAQMRAASTLLAGFTEAVEVAVGAPITSRDWNLFSAALTERILSGLGDTVFRCCEYLLGLYRSMLAPDRLGLRWHAEAEYFEVFQALRPNVANWPLALVAKSGLPEPEGPNPQNPMMAWVYGNVGAKMDNEARRLNAIPASLNLDTPASKFIQAKLARGLRDPATGYENAPARECALQFAKLAYRKDGYFGLSYGGFLPGPGKLSTACDPPCVTSGCTLPTRDNLEIYFTATRPDVAVPADIAAYYTATTESWPADPAQNVNRITFLGTCLLCDDDLCPPGSAAPPSRCTSGSGEYCLHLYVHYELPLGWWVIFNDGTEAFLAKSDWVEGPYTQVQALSHDYGDQIRRAVNGFNREFRGSDTQRAVEDYDNDEAFDIQAYMTLQNFMAPARGIQSGETISAASPIWRLGPGAWLAGQKLNGDFGSTTYSWADGFVGTHVLAWLETTDTSKTVRLTLKAASGNYEMTASKDGQIIRLPDTRLTSVTVELAEGVTLAAGENIVIEATELEQGKPNWWDMYVVMRKAGARLVGSGGGPGNQFTDGIGTEEEQARVICDEYVATGAIVNQADVASISDPTSVNENAVYDAARRMYQTCRIMNRFVLRDYSVEGGDSILWFTPHPRTGGLGDAETDAYPMENPEDEGDPDIDLFEGMTVERIPPVGGSSQRWVFGLWLKPYTVPPAPGNPKGYLDPELYGDLTPDVNRCIVDDVYSVQDVSFRRHTNRSMNVAGRGNYYGQAPSGWNYAQTFAVTPTNVNHVGAPYTDEQRIMFAKSCRVYEPPMEIRSIERVIEGNTELVKVTLMGRLRNTHGETNGAPETISRSGWKPENTSCPTGGGGVALSPGGWNFDTISAEPFACDERNLRLYLFERWCEVHDTASFTWGDGAISKGTATRWGGSSRQPAIMPHFYFLKLPPMVRVDQDDTETAEDAIHDHDAVLQCEWILRCMVEGSLAGEGTLDCSDPATARAYDWTWRNLCQTLFGMSGAGSLATVKTDDKGGELAEGDVRADQPEGFGPLPNTTSASEVFNRLVKIVNSLTRWRVMLPWKAEYRAMYGESDPIRIPEGTDYGCGGTSACAISPAEGEVACTIQGNPVISLAETIPWTDFDKTVTVTGRVYCLIAGCWSPTDPGFKLVTYREANNLRFDLIDPHVYLHAVPESWRGLMNEDSTNMGAVFSVTDTVDKYDAIPGSPSDCTSAASMTCEFIREHTENSRCVFMTNGELTLDCAAYAPGGWKYADLQHGCGQGPVWRTDMIFLNDTTPIVELPVVRREEWVVVPH